MKDYTQYVGLAHHTLREFIKGRYLIYWLVLQGLYYVWKWIHSSAIYNFQWTFKITSQDICKGLAQT